MMTLDRLHSADARAITKKQLDEVASFVTVPEGDTFGYLGLEFPDARTFAKSDVNLMTYFFAGGKNDWAGMERPNLGKKNPARYNDPHSTNNIFSKLSR
jgi:hypothetical protein